jgi:hypothetical protein
MEKNARSCRVVLEVPFEEKDQAKELGAWWDPDLRKWFIPPGKDIKPFLRWLPEETNEDRV